jgi:hypothetical protein
MITENQLSKPSGRRSPETWEKLLNTIHVALVGLILLGSLPVVLHVLMNFHIVRFSDPKSELPLMPMVSIAVSKDGIFYVGLEWWGRIQLYDADGRFLRGFPIASGGGLFHLGFDDHERLYVDIIRENTRVVFGRDGRPVHEEHFDDFDLPSNYWDQSSLTHYQSKEGITADIAHDHEGFWVVFRNSRHGDAHLVRLKDSTGWSFLFTNSNWEKMFTIGIILDFLLYIIRKKRFPGIPIKTIEKWN